MPVREKNKMGEACLSVHIFRKLFVMKTNYPLSARTETAIELDNEADQASMKI